MYRSPIRIRRTGTVGCLVLIAFAAAGNAAHVALSALAPDSDVDPTGRVAATESKPPGAAQTALPAIAVTFDDLPLGGRQFGLGRLRDMTDRLVAEITAAGVPAVGFVNEQKLYNVVGEVDGRIEVLRTWTRAGLELGNHTFSHPSLNTTPLVEFKADVLRGEAVSHMLDDERQLPFRYFRHPFLRTGSSLEDRHDFEAFLAAHGYTVAPVTIETVDWMFAAVYERAVTAGDEARRQQVAAAYLQFTEAQFAYFEDATLELFDRPIPHVLLLHANELNADYFAAVVGIMEARGYAFVTLEEALHDPAYDHDDVWSGGAGPSWVFRWDHYERTEMGASRRTAWRAEPAPPDGIQQAYETGG